MLVKKLISFEYLAFDLKNVQNILSHDFVLILCFSRPLSGASFPSDPRVYHPLPELFISPVLRSALNKTNCRWVRQNYPSETSFSTFAR